MKRKEIKKWVDEAIEKGYDKSDVNDLLASQHEEGKLSKEDWDKTVNMYEDRFVAVEKTKLSFFERIKLKKSLKRVKMLVEASAEEIMNLTKHTKALNKKEAKKLEELKEHMIVAIVGDKKKAKDGLNTVFDVADENGKEITREMLETYPVNDVEELVFELIEALEREI